MATWVPVYKAAKFPEVEKVYKRAGRGQGTTQAASLLPNPNSTMPTSQPKGFLQTVQNFVRGNSPGSTGGHPLPTWIRLAPGVEVGSWQNYQVDVTNIPGVRALRKDGKCVRGPQ